MDWLQQEAQGLGGGDPLFKLRFLALLENGWRISGLDTVHIPSRSERACRCAIY